MKIKAIMHGENTVFDDKFGNVQTYGVALQTYGSIDLAEPNTRKKFHEEYRKYRGEQ